MKEITFYSSTVKRDYPMLYKMFSENGDLDIGKIVALFPNANYLLVIEEVLSDVIIRHILTMIEEGTSAKMEKIEFYWDHEEYSDDDYDYGLSVVQCLKDYGSLFETQKWKMQIPEESHHGYGGRILRIQRE